MSLTINPSVTMPPLLTSSTAISANGTTGFSVNSPAATTTAAATSNTGISNTNTATFSQLSADIQSLLTQLQASGQAGTGQDTDGDGSVSADSGAAAANGSTTNPAATLQSDVNNVVSDLFSLLSATSTTGASSASSATGNTSAGTTTAASTTGSQASTTSTFTNDTTATSSLANLLAQDFAQAIQNYASAGLQTNSASQLIAAA